MKKMLILGFVLAVTLVFAACANDPPEAPQQGAGTAQNGGDTGAAAGTNNDDAGTADNDTANDDDAPATPAASGPLAAMDAAAANFPFEVLGNLPNVDNNTLRYAVGANTTFSGLLDPLFTDTLLDSNAAGFVVGGNFIGATPEFTIHPTSGLVAVEFVPDAMQVILTQQHEANWHDGVPVTLDDLVFAWEVISHPDYQGVRFDSSFLTVEGVQEFRDQEADTISGLILSDDHRQLTMQFTDFPQSLVHFGFWTTPAPRHHLEHIPVGELQQHANVRENTLGFGPFTLESHVFGESYLFVRNEDFWMGAPRIERILYEIVPPSNVPMALQQGLFDVGDIPASMVLEFADSTNFTMITSPVVGSFDHWTFVLGTEFDMDAGRVVTPDPETMRMGNVNLRRAIAHAVNWQDAATYIMDDLLVPAGSIFTPMHRGFIDTSIPPFDYNPEYAMQLLDEAGFIDIDGDGWREFPDGSEMILTALRANPPTTASEMLLAFSLQSVQDIGINIQLFEGVTHDFQAWVGRVTDSDPFDFDIIIGGWSAGWDPNPSSLWGPEAQFNLSRHSSDELSAILDTINSAAMWDDAVRLQAYSDFQRYFSTVIPAFATFWPLDITGVNNRVQNFSAVRRDDPNVVGAGASHLWELTAAEPILP
ncbi:MAG: ABC transporter substrate-binding protein [Defluviitaleaceae bacterium]|nr:ABC transporter substrate-binding protein [Defluviitaleaceae bacterium]